MDSYHTRQPMCRKAQLNYMGNQSQPVMFSTPSQPIDSCPYQGVDRLPLAMAYVPWQQWQNIYDPSKALWVGTIFQDLDLPFCERSCLNS